MAIKRMITGGLYDVQPVYIFLNVKKRYCSDMAGLCNC